METVETIRTCLQQGEWVTSIDFKDAYFHIPIQEQSRKYLRFHDQGQTYQFKALPFGLSTAPLEFTVVAKEVKLMATHKGIRIHQYLDDWLVRARPHQICLQHTQDLVKICQELGWMVNLETSELEPKQIFNFVGYQFDLKVIPIPRSLHPPLTTVATGRQHSHRPTITPNKTCSANLYRRIKRRVGRSLKRTHCERVLVPTRKQAAYKLSGTKAVFLALKAFQDLCTDKIVLVATDNTTVVSYINKEGGMRSGPLCALLWGILTWCTRHQVTLKARHIPGRLNVVADKLSRLCQTIQTEWSLLQEVFQAICSKWHEVQQQVTSVCVTGTRSPGHSSRCTQSATGGSGRICLYTSSPLGQSDGEVAGLPMQENHFDCSGVAQHALVLGPGDNVKSNPTEPSQSAQPVNTALQSDPSQKSDKSKSPRMAPRASAIKEQGFSETVAARIEAPQRGSTRSVYEAK